SVLDKAAQRSKSVAFLDDVDISALESALEKLLSGDTDGGKKLLIRFGVDLLAAKTNEYVMRTAGVQGEGCAKCATVWSFFCKRGAACAAYLLIQSAYHPIADY